MAYIPTEKWAPSKVAFIWRPTHAWSPSCIENRIRPGHASYLGMGKEEGGARLAPISNPYVNSLSDFRVWKNWILSSQGGGGTVLALQLNAEKRRSQPRRIREIAFSPGKDSLPPFFERLKM